ncbi:FtsX-like permease family protein [Microbacterium sp. STN6]|uniref:ABC transporter permease n=1 Tax=Microbacterium sp. STN6 TaxID=2995588 RepID=UPI002260BDAD|nr:ABC transporter permease [Microbacterium sp. STN6]MCX7522888.1 FtsX-like permease family protein [Microbacterium sp. STN6]
MVNTLVRAAIRQHKGSFVGVFVAVLTATMLATGLGILIESGIRGGVHPERYSAADVMVGAQQSFDTAEGVTVPLNERVPLPADALAALRQLPAAARVVADTTTPLAWAGSPVEAHGWSSAALTPYRLVHGHAPQAPDQVVVTGAAATRTEVGATITLRHGGVPARYRVVGIAAAATAEQPARAQHVFLSDAAASALAPLGGAPSVVGVFARPGVSPDQLAGEIRTGIPDVATYTGDQRGNAEFLDVGVARGTLVAIGSSFAGTAILIALFVVASTLSLSIQSRRRDYALMRAIGATPLQIIHLVVREVLVIAGAGALIGAAPGYLLASAMRFGFAQAGVIPADFALASSPIPALGAIVLVVAAALLAAVVAARRPARINPIEALREASTTPARLGRGRTTTGIVLGIVGLLASAMPLVVQGAIAVTGPAAALLLLLISAGLLGPRLVRIAMAVFGGPLRRSPSPSAFLAATNARSNSRRLAAAIIPIALGIGLGLVQVGTGQIVATEASAQSHAGLTADLVVAGGASGISGDGAAVIARAPGVQAANPVALSDVTLSYVLLGDPSSQQYAAQGVDPSTDASTLDLDMVAGSLHSLKGIQTVALSTDAAQAAGAHVGDTVHEHLGDGTRVDARVVAIYTRGLGFGDVTMANAALREHTTTGLSNYVLVSTQPGQRAQVQKALADAGFTVTTRDGLDAVGDGARDANSAVNLIALVVILGYIAIAVVNTLVMATGERRREFALLQLLGATRRQVRSMMRAESIMVAVIAAVLGVLLAAPPLVGISLGISGQPLPGISPVTTVAIVASLSVLAMIALALATRSTMRTAPISEIGSRE